MGLSNKIIFSSGYRTIKEYVVETDIGNFKCVLLKEKCMNKFKIKVKQISVKYGGINYFVHNNLEVFKIPIKIVSDYDNVGFTGGGIVKLKKYTYEFILEPQLILNKMLEDFKYDLIEKLTS